MYAHQTNKIRYNNIVICVAALGHPVVGGGGKGKKRKGFQAFLSIFFYLCSVCIIS